MLFSFSLTVFLVAELYRGPGNTLLQSYHFDDDRYIYTYDRGFKLSDSRFTTRSKYLWPWSNFPGRVIYDSRSGVLYHLFSAGAYSQAPVNGGENYDVYVIKTDLQGNPLWNDAVRLTEDVYELSSGADGVVDNDGNLYVAYYNQGVPGIFYQKILSDGTLAWDGNTSMEGKQSLLLASGTFTDPAVALGDDGYVYVAYTSNSYVVYLNAFSMVDGTKKWATPIRISPSSGEGHPRAQYPDIVYDGNLFWIAWRADDDATYNNYNVYIRSFNPADESLGSLVKVNVGDYDWGQQWYGLNSYEHMVSMAYDGSRYIYLAFPAKFKTGSYAGEIKVLLQKFDTVSLSSVWPEDVVAQQVYDTRIERVPQVAWDPVRNLLWVVWLRGGGPAYFNAFDKDGNPWFEQEIEVSVGDNGDNIVVVDNTVFIGNHAGDKVFRYSVYGLLLDQFKPNVYINYYTQAYMVSTRIIPGRVGSAKIRVDESVFNPSLPEGASVAFSANGGSTWVDDGGNVLETAGEVSFSGTDAGSDFRVKIILNGNSLKAHEPPYCDLLVVEATDVAWADASISLNGNGASPVGVLDFSSSQELVQYAGPGDTVYAYVFARNMGNNDTLEANFTLPTTDGSGWDVSYNWWEWNGTDWTEGGLISDGSSSVSTTSFSLPSYDGTPSTQKALKISVKAPVVATTGDSYSVAVSTVDSSGNWHDTVVLRVVYSAVLPDLEISRDGLNFVGRQVYNLDGAFQTLNDTQDCCVERDFFIRLTNRGEDNQNITVYTTGSHNGWNVTYYLWNGTNWVYDDSLTSSLQKTFYDLNHDEQKLIKAVVYPDSTVSLGDQAQFRIKALSGAGTVEREDVVAFEVSRASSSFSLNDNITRVVDLSQQWQYYLTLVNDSGYRQEFYVKQTQALPAGWSTSFYDGYTDITSSVLGSGYSFELGSAQSKNIRVVVIAPASGVGTNSTQILKVWAYNGCSDSGTVVYSKDFSATFFLIDSKGDLVLSDGTDHGENVYESTPSTQVLEKYVVLGTNATYTLKIDEDGTPQGSDANTYNLTWVSSGSQSIYIYDGATSVFSPFTTEPLLSSGSSHNLTVLIDTSGASVDEISEFYFNLTSNVNPGERDSFKIVQHATYPPDLYAKRTYPTEGIVVGSYRFPDDMVQGGLAWGSGASVTYYFWVHNRRTVSENITLNATAISTPWGFVYEQADDPNSPTTWTSIDPVNSTITYQLSPDQRILFRLRVWVEDWSSLSEGDGINATVSVCGEETGLVDSMKFTTVVGAGKPLLSAGRTSAYCESGEEVALEFTLSNMANATSEAFLLKATVSSPWSVEFYYLEDSENATWRKTDSSILSAGWQAPQLSPSQSLRMKIVASSTFPSGSILDVDLVAYSQVDPTVTSSVSFHFVMVDPRPDLVVEERGNLYGENIYDTTTEVQTTSSGSYPGVFQVYLQNDDVVVGSFNLTGSWNVNKDEWRVRVIDSVHGDITGSLKNGVVYTIPPGENATITVQVYQVYQGALAPPDAVLNLKVLSLKNQSRWDSLKLVVSASRVKVGLEVVDRSGKPLKAKVHVENQSQDVNGRAEMLLIPGIYRFRVESPGYISEERVVDVRGDDNLTFQLVKANLASVMDVHGYPTKASLQSGHIGIVYVAPAGSRVKVALYDVRGRLVKVLFEGISSGVPEKINWSLRNEKGESVAPGVYFVVIKSDSGKTVRKVFITP